jgi:hypothetical protein
MRQGRPAWNRLPYGHNASASERQNLNGDDTGPARPPPSFFACGAGRSGRRRDGEDGRPRHAPRARGIVPPSAVTNFRSARGPPPGPDEAEHGGRCTQFEVTTPGARTSARPSYAGRARAPSEVLNPMAAPPARWSWERQPETPQLFSAAVSARAIQANPPTDRAYGRPRRRLGSERLLRPVPESGTSGHWAPRVTTRARPCPSHAEPQHHPGLGQSRRRPTRSPRRGGATRGGAATTWHRLSFSTPLPPHGGGRGRAAGRAPRRSRAQRGGGGARTATRSRAPRLRSPVYPPGGPSSAPWSNVGLQALMSGVFRDRV